MMKHRFQPIIAAAVAALSLAAATGACSAKLTLTITVTPEKVATDVGQALVDQINPGMPLPPLDCGTEDIEISEGKSVTCELYDETAAAVYDVAITFSEVTMTDWQMDIQVADTPN